MSTSRVSRPNVLKDPEVAHMVVRGRKEWAAFGLFVAELDKEVGWHTNKVYDGHTLKKKGRSWLLVIKVWGVDGAEVAFFDSRTPVDCFRLFYEKLYKSSIKWVKSKY